MKTPANAAGLERISRPMAGRQLGRYEILTQLASGGMASVYIARAQGVAGFERLVAIKVLHPHLAYEQEFISMFLDEARLAARIRHTNVVPTLDISESPGDGYFLVMEYIEGNHLGVLLGRAAQQGERLPRPFICRVLIDTLQGLAAAHRLTDENGSPLKLVHRDVSPHNILVGTDGIARLTDFGVAKADVRMASTRAGQFKGKLSYMAPEQASSSQADQRSDLFSVGIILWESLTGRRLFRGETNAATLNKLLNETVVKPSAYGEELEPFDEIVMKALSRNPEQRFQSADELGEALDLAAGRGGVAKTRDVAEVVRALDAEKLLEERQRVRDAIELLGRAEFAESKVPMPRNGPITESRTYSRRDETSQVHPSTLDESDDGAGTAGHRSSRGSEVLRWIVMILAIAVFLYAAFLVWQLPWQPAGAGQSVPASATPGSAPKVERAKEDESEPNILEVEPPRPADGARSSTQKPATDASSKRKKNTRAARSRRRRVRNEVESSAKPAERPKKPSAPEGTPPEPHIDPVDIDIRNPYRN